MKIKKIISSLVSGVMIAVTVLPVFSAAENTATVPEGYIPVYDIEDLYNIRNDRSKKYILMNDIDLSETAPGGDWDSGNGWSPVNNFSGTFDGNGHIIKNMHIYGDVENGSVLGLFGNISSRSTVTKVALVDCDINVRVITLEYSKADRTAIGGIVGSGECPSVSYREENIPISQCYVTGKINVVNESEYDCCVGGICGYYYDSDFYYGIEDSYNTASISLTSSENESDSVGGILGYVKYYGKVRNTYNVGSIAYKDENGNDNGNIGNIIGYGSSANYSYYLEDADIYAEFGGGQSSSYSLSKEQMKSESSFEGFDFSKVWTINPGSDYPYPTLIDVPHTGASFSEIPAATTQAPVSSGKKMGDLNGDNKVDAIDASLILAYYAYLSTGGTIGDMAEWIKTES